LRYRMHGFRLRIGRRTSHFGKALLADHRDHPRVLPLSPYIARQTGNRSRDLFRRPENNGIRLPNIVAHGVPRRARLHTNAPATGIAYRHEACRSCPARGPLPTHLQADMPRADLRSASLFPGCSHHKDVKNGLSASRQHETVRSRRCGNHFQLPNSRAVCGHRCRSDVAWNQVQSPLVWHSSVSEHTREKER
jgi:hypothetical protein